MVVVVGGIGGKNDKEEEERQEEMVCGTTQGTTGLKKETGSWHPHGRLVSHLGREPQTLSIIGGHHVTGGGL